MKKIFATVMLFITALCFSGRASATLELEITGGQDIGYPIAVSDFAAAAVFRRSFLYAKARKPHCFRRPCRLHGCRCLSVL